MFDIEVCEVRVLGREYGSSEFCEVVKGGVAGEVLDMDFEGSECWGVAFVESFDGNHAVEHGFQLCQCGSMVQEWDDAVIMFG